VINVWIQIAIGVGTVTLFLVAFHLLLKLETWLNG
jgi:hypothetical protein